MRLALELWGGMFFLLQKIFCSFLERSSGERKRFWRIWSWVVYIVGLPPWLTIFVWEHNWIMFAVEFGGLPGMALGLANAARRRNFEERTSKLLDAVARVTAVLGIAFSAYYNRGFVSVNQYCELLASTGFLIGTYLLAQKIPNPKGYLWFLLMNGATAMLMYFEHHPWMVAQQILSLLFIWDAYRTEKKGRTPNSSSARG